jgi:putative MFS transporter
VKADATTPVPAVGLREPTIAQRIDGLPFSGFHWKVYLMSTVALLFESTDGALLAFVLPVVIVLWHLSDLQTGVLASSLQFGQIIGYIGAGIIADTYGRRLLMMLAVATFSIFTVACAAATNWIMFAVLRVAAGVGTAAELGIIMPYLAEWMPLSARGRTTSSIGIQFTIGAFLAAVIGNVLIRPFHEGWRIALVLAGLPVLLLVWWRRGLLESPRWLENHGRHAEALRIVELAEQRVGARVTEAAALTDDEDLDPRMLSLGQKFRLLLSRPLRATTIGSWLMWLGVTAGQYGFMLWLPTILVKEGFTMTRSFSYSLLVYSAQIFAALTVAALNGSGRVDRRLVIITGAACAIVAALFISSARTPTAIAEWGFVLTFCTTSAFNTSFVYTAEIYPTACRAIGLGVAAAIGRVGGVISPIGIGAIYPFYGVRGVGIFISTLLIVGVVAMSLFGTRTHDRSLEEVTRAQFRTTRG